MTKLAERPVQFLKEAVHCFKFTLRPQHLTHYAQSLGLDEQRALERLAWMIATQAAAASDSTKAVLSLHHPHLALFWRGDSAIKARIEAQALALDRACSDLLYVDAVRARQLCAKLARRLTEACGEEELSRASFIAIPNGGFMVLDQLASVLALQPEQLGYPERSDRLVVVVDDCALSGVRFHQFLQTCSHQRILFAHLYSHPDLRSAINARELRVVGCLSAEDLHDRSSDALPSEHRRRRMERVESGECYWVGSPEALCFPWNEPDRSFWNPVTHRQEKAWRIVPPELCSKNRFAPDTQPIPIQIQPMGQGNLRPSKRVVFGDLEGSIVLCDTETYQCFGLEGVAADLWRSIVRYGHLEEAVSLLQEEYDVPGEILQKDAGLFFGDLESRGLIERLETAPLKNYRLFGLNLSSDFPFTYPLVEGRRTSDLSFHLASGPAVPGPWKERDPIYSSPSRSRDGKSMTRLYRLENCEALCFSGSADFYLQADSITGHLLNPALDFMLELRFVGPVLSYWLERQGIPTLHASAVATNSGAIAFLSHKEGGKTGLAAAFLQAGFSLLTDDVLPVEEANGRFLARPGYPQMRMWPDEAAFFVPGWEELPTVHSAISKRRVFVGGGGFGTFHDASLPLACLYLPERVAEGPVEIEDVSPRDAVIELLRHSFSPRLVEAVGLGPRRLDFFARLAMQVPVRRLRYPSGFDRLPEVVERVLG